MVSESNQESDERELIIYVGQDRAGHWLVQDSRKNIEGRFVSRSAAFSFAKAEGQIYHAPVMIPDAPLIPVVSFWPLAPEARATSLAA